MRKELPATESSAVRTLVRGLDVLKLFGTRHAQTGEVELVQSEIAAALELPLPTVHRLCATLVRQGFLARDSGSRRFRLGPEIIRLAGPTLAALGSLEHARSVLRGLAEATGESANLGTLVGSEVVYLDCAPGGGMLGPRAAVGQRVPAHCTALGKSLLARLEPAVARRQLGGQPYQRRTPATLTTWAELAAALHQVRESGVAVSREEYEQGLLAVAVPLTVTTHGPPLAIDVSIPAVRATEEVIAAVTKQLLDAAGAVNQSAAAGGLR